MRRFRFWLLKLYVRYRVQVDPKAKCVACGHRQAHKIVYSAAYRSLIHQCAFCCASWAEKPVVAAEEWTIAPQQAEPVEPQTAFGAPREPKQAKAA